MEARKIGTIARKGEELKKNGFFINFLSVAKFEWNEEYESFEGGSKGGKN